MSVWPSSTIASSWLCHEPPRDEREGSGGSLIEPLSIVDDADQRLLLGNFSQQPEDCQPHLEPIRWWAGAKTERDLHGLALRTREALERVEHRPEQLLQAGERKLHVGLHAGHPRHHASRRLLDQLLEQGGLSDTCLAAHDQGPAASGPNAGQEPAESLSLTAPPA